ncbi:peptidase M42, partial [Pseudobutyrivibrio sp.]
MKTKEYVEYMVKQAVDVLDIDSPTGFTKNAADHIIAEYKKLGFEPKLTTKGGVIVDLGGKNSEDAILVEAHMDTLGGMVCKIKDNGNLELTPLGGFSPNNGEAENCRIYTRDGKIYEGTFQLNDASVHVNDDYKTTAREFKSMEVVVDEEVSSADDTKKLGIMIGDIVAFEPRTRVTKSGYIKSRFLDDKLSVGILLGQAKYLADNKITPERRLFHHITVYEEVGHGA